MIHLNSSVIWRNTYAFLSFPLSQTMTQNFNVTGRKKHYIYAKMIYFIIHHSQLHHTFTFFRTRWWINKLLFVPIIMESCDYLTCSCPPCNWNLQILMRLYHCSVNKYYQVSSFMWRSWDFCRMILHCHSKDFIRNLRDPDYFFLINSSPLKLYITCHWV